MDRPVQRVNAPAFGTEVIAPGGAPLPDWWDPNQSGLSVVAAYRAINTPGNPWPNDAPNVYADTLINNANPGVNDLVEGNGAVPWAAVTGWTFVAAGAQWLDTGVQTVNTNWSMFCQLANVLNNGNFFLAGAFAAGQRFYLSPNNFGRLYYGNGGAMFTVPGLLTGNAGFGDSTAYRNGVNDGVIPGGVPPALNVFIGALNNGGAAGNFISADVESLVIYDDTTVAQVQADTLAIATAMGQL